MKVCPVCRTTYADDSNVFCLNDGTTLVDEQSFRQLQTQPRAKSSLPLVLAILAGFMIFAVIVGAVGLYLFTRGAGGNRNEEQKSISNNSARADNQSKTGASVNANRALPPVQIETNRAANAKAHSSPAASLPAVITSASSVRRADKGNFYFPTFAFDKNPSTAWCEGGAGAGIGEWIDFQFNGEVRLRQINIQPGYFKSQQSWRDNNRVAAATIEFSDGSSQNADFADRMEMQTVSVGQKQTRWVRITIEDVHRGGFDAEDTLISEVSFVTEP